jgi:hypothetical protein
VHAPTARGVSFSARARRTPLFSLSEVTPIPEWLFGRRKIYDGLGRLARLTEQADQAKVVKGWTRGFESTHREHSTARTSRTKYANPYSG